MLTCSVNILLLFLAISFSRLLLCVSHKITSYYLKIISPSCQRYPPNICPKSRHRHLPKIPKYSYPKSLLFINLTTDLKIRDYNIGKDDYLKQKFSYHYPRIYWQHFTPKRSLPPVSFLLILHLASVVEWLLPKLGIPPTLPFPYQAIGAHSFPDPAREKAGLLYLGATFLP